MAKERNEGLERAIREAPDSDDGYLVYGDWLAEQEHPRGEWITTLAALLHKPKDKKLKKAADDLFRGQRKKLMGTLAASKPKELVLEWHLGFIRSARIAIKDESKRKKVLKSLLQEPSSAFLRSLSIAQVGAREPLVADAYSTILLAAKVPPPLENLVIGTPANFDPTSNKRLTKLYPRLRRSLDACWESVLATIDEQKRLTLKYKAASFPPLKYQKDAPELPKIAKDQVLKGLKLDLDKKRNLGVVALMKRTFTPECLDAWAVKLGDEFARSGHASGQRWGFLAMGQIGGDKTVKSITANLRSWTYGRAEQGVGLLQHLATYEAIFNLYALSIDDDVDRRSLRAREALTHIAESRKLSVESLVDRAIPHTPTGPRKTQVAAALERRLETFLENGHRFSRGEFGRYMLRHPLAFPLAQRVLWGAFNKSGFKTSFRLSADGELLDAKGNSVDVAGLEIGVLHPIEIPKAKRPTQVSDWSKAFESGKVKPLFLQLERPTYELGASEMKGSQLKRYEGTSFSYRNIDEVLVAERGWFNRHEWEEGNFARRTFFRDNTEIVMHVDDFGKVASVILYEAGSKKKRSLKSLHPVTVSEILYDLESARQSYEKVDSAKQGEKSLTKGMAVRVYGKKGTLFWIGKDKRTGEARAGVKTEGGETIWADLGDVSPVPPKKKKATAAKKTTAKKTTAKKTTAKKTTAKKTAAKKTTAKKKKEAFELKKGVTVDYDLRGDRGTGFVFWVGENKYGPGLRAGIKDGETGETVWAAESEVSPAS